MRLNGVGVTRPICDWRPFLEPTSRFRFIAPREAEAGNTFIHGFGLCQLRRKPRIPWRATDLMYFDCSRAIQLPTRLPDGAPVTRWVHRVYLDDFALARFELAIFADPHKLYLSNELRPDRFAAAFWGSTVRLTQWKDARPMTLWRALNELGDYFEIRTSPLGISPPHRIVALEPQLIVVAEAETAEMPSGALPINSEATLWLVYQPVPVDGRSAPVDTLFLINLPGYFRDPLGTEFDRHRMVRAHIGSLHADLQILTHILDKVSAGSIDSSLVSQYLLDLCRSLRSVPQESDQDHQIVSELLRVHRVFHDNPFSRILQKLDASPGVDAVVRAKVHALLDQHGTHASARPQPKPTSVSRAEASDAVNDKLREVIALFAEALTGSSPPRLRYDDEKFRLSAQNKAKGVYDRLPKTMRHLRLLFVSIGGADGTELFQLLDLAGTPYGILLEKSRDSCKKAERDAKHRGARVEVFPGDVMQELDEAMNLALKLRDEGTIDRIVVTAQAVLHELPTRSPEFRLQAFFSKVYQADVIIGREPVEPGNWPIVVRLGSFDADRFIKAAQLIRMYHPGRFSDDRYNPTKINESFVRLHRALALETLTKVFYSEDFLYELEECVTSYSDGELERELVDCLSSTHSVRSESLTSDSVHRFWNVYGLEAKSDQYLTKLGEPRSHCWYCATRRNIDP